MSGVTGLEDDTYIKSILRLLRLLSSSVSVCSSGVYTYKAVLAGCAIDLLHKKDIASMLTMYSDFSL